MKKTILSAIVASAMFTSIAYPSEKATLKRDVVLNEFKGETLTIPWLESPVEFWKTREPTVVIPGDETQNNAIFWIAVDKDGILIHSEISDDSQRGGRSSKILWKGDSIQIAIDALNNGATELPQPVDIEKELALAFPEDASLSGKERSLRNKKRKALSEQLKKHNKGYKRGKQILPDDADYGFGLSEKGEVLAYSFYHGRLGYGGEKEGFANITRDDENQKTTYDIKIPWSDFNMSGLVSPNLRIAIQVNDVDLDEEGKKVKGKYNWGEGLGGIFMPCYFKGLHVSGIPKTHSAFYLYKNEFLNRDDSIEFYSYSPVGTHDVTVKTCDESTQIDFKTLPGEEMSKFSYKPHVLPNRTKEYEFYVNGELTLKENAFNESKEDWYAFETQDNMEATNRKKYLPVDESEAAVVEQRAVRGKQWWDKYKGKHRGDKTPVIKYDIPEATVQMLSDKIDGSVFDMSDWLDAPAGKHGPVLLNKDKFEFANGEPIKFWGSQQCYNLNAIEKTKAVVMARKCAKFGINIMRFHKFSYFGNGIASLNDNQFFDTEKLDQMDFYINELKRRGVYYGFSTFFGHTIHPSFSDKLKFPEEIIKIAKNGKIKSSTYGIVNVAEDIQDLLIEWQIKILNHENPYTGMKYADDPALAFVEMHNEDDIFWYSTQQAMDARPQYAREFSGIFSDWLMKKYGSHEKLVEAWGETALSNREKETGYYFFQQKFFDEDEHLDKRNIYPIANAWFYSKYGIQDQQDNPKIKGKKRLLDNMAFLYEFQNKFYARYKKAIRDTGYKGPLVASCWEAGGDASQFLNLHSDALIGTIDRHNYHGGQSGFTAHKGTLVNTPMVSKQGYSILSAGMMQVANRPFALSEWTGSSPYEWMADSASLIAIYGMGLQGWDTSCQFQWGLPNFENDLIQKWGFNTPLNLGLYPALSRMVLRGDVTESEIVSKRNVCIKEVLKVGAVNFTETKQMILDEKYTTGKEVPGEGLAYGRLVVNYTEEEIPTKTLDVKMKDGIVTSVTDELQWKRGTGMAGYVTVNTKATKAVVGFAPNKKFQLGDMAITLKNRFATLYVTSLEKDKDLTNCKRILIQTIARGYNTGMEYDLSHNAVEKIGTGPIIMEPVVAEIDLGVKSATVNILDHDGRRTGRTIECVNGIINLDGAKDKTLYYEVVRINRSEH